MTSFLESDGGASWVLHDLKMPFVLAGCKALGLISKLITGPLWNLIEDPCVHIIDMNERYLQLVDFLFNCDVDLFLVGQARPFPDRSIKEDALFKALIASSEYDADCTLYLKSLLPALGKLCQKLYQDHLPGGRYVKEATAEVKKAAKGTAKHNKYCETVFALHMTTFYVPGHTHLLFLQKRASCLH